MGRYLLACACTLLATHAVAAPPVFNIKEVTYPAGARSLYLLGGMNDLGEVVGSTEVRNAANVSESIRAFLWSPTTGKFTTLTSLDSTPNTRSFDYAYAINNKHQIVGLATNDAGKRRATLWKGTTVKQLAAFPNQTSSYAVAINSSGQIVGEVRGGSCSAAGCAVIWFAGGKMELGLPKSTFESSSVSDINDAGTVVGTRHIDDISQAYIWTAATGWADLPSMHHDGNGSMAASVNKDGRVVGRDGDDAIAWKAGTHEIVNLRNQIASTADGGSIADSINDRREVVGSYDDLYFWRLSTGYRLTDLIAASSPLRGCVDLFVATINNNGVIAAFGANTCSGGGSRLYVLTPQ